MADGSLDLTEEERNVLLALARRTLEARVRTGRASPPDRAWVALHPHLDVARGVFVTLEKEGALRGCIGDLAARRPLFRAVVRATVDAAVHDPRFPPVEPDELEDLSLSITVLDAPVPIAALDPDERLAALTPGRDGVILEYEGRRSTFLPQVWRQLPEPVAFLRRLARKQGSPPDAWRDPTARLFRYGAFSFAEPPRAK